MATAVDPVRRTLDTLHLDPNAAGDRPYLESMLRRLGYSEAEIQAALGGAPLQKTGEETVVPAAADTGERHIEVEYTGPGLREFILAVGVDASELPTDPHGLGAGLEAGTEVFEAGPSMEEVDRLVAEGNLGDFDDWGDNPGGPGALTEVAIQEDVMVGEDGKPIQPDGAEGEGEGGTALDLDSLKTDAPVGGAEIAPAGDGGEDFKGTQNQLDLPVGQTTPGAEGAGGEFQVGEGMVEFKPQELNEAETELVDPAKEAEALAAEGWDVADPETGEFPPEPVPEDTGGDEFAQGTEDADGFHYGDWTLYKRDELRGDQPQRVYFFSTGKPDGGEPATVPDGYEVAQNPETGRPFLRRSPDSGASPVQTGIESAHPSADPQSAGEPRKRVRILRVRAATREEAIQKLRAEGRNVIASMPIDIEKKLR